MKRILNLLFTLLVALNFGCEAFNDEHQNEVNYPTEENPSSTLTFKIEISFVSWDSAMVLIDPSNDEEFFYFDIIEKSAYDQYDSDEAFMAEKVAELKAACEAAGTPLSEVDRFTNEGWNYDKVLTPTTDYYVYAFGLTLDGVVTTELTKFAFSTLPVGGNIDDGPAGFNHGDTTIDDLSRGSYMNIKDFYGVGASTWVFSLLNEDGTSSLSIEFQFDLSATEPTLGTYPLDNTFAVGTAVAGGMDFTDHNYGTNWIHIDGENFHRIVDMVFCKSGSVTLDKNGNDYIITLDAIDEYGNTVKASYSGELSDDTQVLE